MLNLKNIESKHLILRAFKELDIEKVHGYASDSEVTKYVPFGPNTLKESEEFVKMCIEYQYQKERVDFELAVICKSNNELIGVCGIHISDKTNREGWIGYVFNRIYWGKGYGTEVAKILLSFGFNQLNLHRVYATCHPDNIGSQRILEKNGMKREGHLRENIYVRGQWRDSLLYAILEDEYKY